MSAINEVLYSHEDDIAYWIAWSELDNPQGKDTEPLMYRVFRDGRGLKPEPMTEPMTKEEVCVRFEQIGLILKGSNP